MLLERLLHVFDETQAAVLQLIRMSSWPRFKNSREFKADRKSTRLNSSHT